MADDDKAPATAAGDADLRPAGAWADDLGVEDWLFNAASAGALWHATPRTTVTRRSGRRLEPGREVTLEQFQAAIAAVDGAVAR